MSVGHPASPTRGRDPTLDGMRGLACLLMIFAHTYTPEAGGPARAVFYLGGFAPALFFAVAGALAWEQARRKSVAELVGSYAAIFVLGISYNLLLTTLPGSAPGAGADGTPPTATATAFRAAASCDILQIVPLGVLATALASRSGRARRSELVGLTAACLAMHACLSPIAPAIPGAQVLFAIGKSHGAIFPALAWIPVFLIGALAARQRVHTNLASSLLCFGLLAGSIALRRLNLPLPANHGVAFLAISKEFFSPPYFFLTAGLAFGCFAFARALPVLLELPPLPRFGRESLLFLYLHMAVIVLLRHLPLPPSPLHWLIVAVAVLLLMHARGWARSASEHVFARFSAQVVLLALAGLVAAGTTNWAALYAASLVAGLAFALHPRGARVRGERGRPLLRGANLT